MNTFKLTMPNGIVIESTWTNEVASTPKVAAAHQPKAHCAICSIPGQRCLEEEHRVLQGKPKAAKQPVKVVKQPKAVKATTKPKASKPAKQDSKSLLAEIRALKVAGKYSEAVAITPPAWTQVIGEIQRAAERGGTTYNAAVSAKPKKAKTRKAKASKKPVVVNEAPKGALDMKADTGSAKPTQLEDRAAKQQQLKASLRDELTDIGVNDFVIDVLTGDYSIATIRDTYCSATEDEVLDLMEACKQEAVLIEDAAERIEDANMDASVVNQLVELWKSFSAKLSAIADSMTAAA